MPIYNLGQYEKRESPVSGFSDALAKGLTIGASLQDVKSKRDYYKLQTDYLEAKKKKQDSERSDYIATQLTTMDEDKRNRLLSTSQGQELLAHLKKDIPTIVDENGNFNGISNEHIARSTKLAYENKIASEKVQIVEKLKSGQPLNQGEQQLASMFHAGKDKSMSNIVDAAILEAEKSGDFSNENMTKLMRKWSNIYQSQQNFRNPYQGSLSPGFQQPTAPTSGKTSTGLKWVIEPNAKDQV